MVSASLKTFVATVESKCIVIQFVLFDVEDVSKLLHDIRLRWSASTLSDRGFCAVAVQEGERTTKNWKESSWIQLVTSHSRKARLAFCKNEIKAVSRWSQSSFPGFIESLLINSARRAVGILVRVSVALEIRSK